jgi:hypothetical protein
MIDALAKVSEWLERYHCVADVSLHTASPNEVWVEIDCADDATADMFEQEFRRGLRQ